MNQEERIVPVVKVVADPKTIEQMMAVSLGADSGDIDEMISEDWLYSMGLEKRISEQNRLSTGEVV